MKFALCVAIVYFSVAYLNSYLGSTGIPIQYLDIHFISQVWDFLAIVSLNKLSGPFSLFFQDPGNAYNDLPDTVP